MEMFVARIGLRATLAAAATALVVGLWPVVARAQLRRRIRRHLELVHKLRDHAAVARALGHCMSKYPERQRALRRVQSMTLAQLSRGRVLVDGLLLQLRGDRAGPVGGPAALAALAACETRTREAVASERELADQLLSPAMAAAAMPSAPLGRPAMLGAEQRALEELQQAPPSPHLPQQQLPQLRRALRSLRLLETDLDFQAELLACQLETEAATGYPRENFAYGSTPLPSWLSLFACEPVRALLEREGAARLPYVVLGSSVGWLVLYGACVHGLPSRGVELMPYLARTAERVAAEAGVAGARFECADMMRVDLGGSRLVLLASQCWDEALVARLRAKLLRELPQGALVLDYTPLLGEPQDPEEEEEGAATAAADDGAAPRRQFELACTVAAPVSWDGAHQFWVWRLVGAP
jgi:hypothetical protein